MAKKEPKRYNLELEMGDYFSCSLTNITKTVLEKTIRNANNEQKRRDSWWDSNISNPRFPIEAYTKFVPGIKIKIERVAINNNKVR